MMNTCRVSLLKPNQLRVRIDNDDERTLEELCGRILSPPVLASMLLHAALQAVRDNGGSMTFPPRFKVDTTPERLELNDKPKKK